MTIPPSGNRTQGPQPLPASPAVSSLGRPEVPAAGPWTTSWLSSARLEPYLNAANGNLSRALELYEWNSRLTAAWHHDLGHLEVALRNAYDAAAGVHWAGPGHWLRDDFQTCFAPEYRVRKGAAHPVDVNAEPRRLIQKAIADSGGRAADPGKVVAQLTFGFWRYLSSRAHNTGLWSPMLRHAFQPGTQRQVVDGLAAKLHDLRNRVAHHETLLSVNLAQRVTDIEALAAVIDPQFAAYVQANSEVSGLLVAKPR